MRTSQPGNKKQPVSAQPITPRRSAGVRGTDEELAAIDSAAKLSRRSRQEFMLYASLRAANELLPPAKQISVAA